MRKICLTIVILLGVVVAVTGCDFFRRLAGRPTSADIEAIREAILEREEAKAATLDTSATIKAPEVSATPTEPPKAAEAGAPSKDGKKRYYIIVASFSQKDNAVKCAERMATRGYPGELISFKGGYTAVGICGTDDEAQAKENLKEVKRQDFCPSGVWILDRNKR